MSVNCEKSQRDVLSYLQTLYYHRRVEETENIHTWEAGTKVSFPEKWPKQLNLSTNCSFTGLQLMIFFLSINQTISILISQLM